MFIITLVTHVSFQVNTKPHFLIGTVVAKLRLGVTFLDRGCRNNKQGNLLRLVI